MGSSSPGEDRVCLRVITVLHRHNHTRIAAYVVRLASSIGGVEHQFVALDNHPNHGELRLALSVERLVVIVEYHIGANQLRVHRESGFSCSVYCHASSPLASEAPFRFGVRADLFPEFNQYGSERNRAVKLGVEGFRLSLSLLTSGHARYDKYSNKCCKFVLEPPQSLFGEFDSIQVCPSTKLLKFLKTKLR